MCLYSKTRIPKIATKDIEVYKVVVQKYGKLVTPYLDYEVSKIMKTSFRECIKAILNMRYNLLFEKYEIDYGFIHSHKYLQSAHFMRSSLQYHNLGITCKIIIGIIPKGSIYYEDITTYCSNKLILDL